MECLHYAQSEIETIVDNSFSQELNQLSLSLSQISTVFGIGNKHVE